MSNRNDLPKSLFISSMIVVACVVVVIWSIKMIQNPSRATFGIILSTGGILIGIGSIFFARVPRTRLSAYTGMVVVGFLLTLSALPTASQFIPDFVIALIMLILWTTYLFWYSRFKYDDQSMMVGEALPPFTLADVEGNRVNSADFKGKPAIFIFYRGNWCPLCMAQINEVAANYHDLQRFGVQTILISNQSHDKTRKLAARFHVDFIFLEDEGGQVAKNMSLFVKNGLPFGMQVFGHKSNAAIPTVIIVDSEGQILHHHRSSNYRLRPDPAVFIQVLKEAGLQPHL